MHTCMHAASGWHRVAIVQPDKADYGIEPNFKNLLFARRRGETGVNIWAHSLILCLSSCPYFAALFLKLAIFS